MDNTSGRFLHTFCVGLALLAAASCSLVGAPLDPLTAADGTCTQCAEGCVDLRSSATSCGACGSACKSGESCASGQCRTACPPGQLACGESCYAVENDPAHCGGCENACKAEEVCSDGRCSANCRADQGNCGGACVDLQSDALNCGACGKVCGANDECVEGACVVACKTQLNQPIVDPWGWAWDGRERAAASLPEAQAACSQFRARLPTASELYRVSAVQSATVGQTFNTNPLWSLAPVSPGVHLRVRLSDAAVAADAPDTAKANYRCVCPPPLPKVFAGGDCFGAPNTNACAPLGGEGGLRAIDAKDRAPIPKGSAVWECAFFGGHLATPVQLAEAVGQGLAGSGALLHSADDARNDLGTLVSWQDPSKFAFKYASQDGVKFGAVTDSYAFRCVGESAAPPAPPLAAGQWTAPSRRNIEAADLPEATEIEALDHCFQAGGHLPTVAELNELVVQGAPDGSGAFLWTSDHTGSNGTNHTNAIVKWTGVQTDHQYGGASMDWSYKTASRPYRCVYYPVDTSYSGPQASACAGGCSTIAMPGGSGATSWFDMTDRPAVNITAAVDTCRKLRGHLASERDLTEAIRAGLPNGSGTYIHTSDTSLGNCGVTWGVCDVASVFVAVVKWTDTQPTFDDLWANDSSSRMDWSKSTTERPFRCTWTNELR